MEWQGRSGVAIVCHQITAAGKAILVRAIKRAGWQPEQFWLIQPGDIPAGCRALVACGDEAQEALTGWFGGKRATKYTRGYVLPSFTGLPTVPTFDPAKVAQGQMKLLGLLMNDIGVALQAAVGARKVCTNPKQITDYKIGLQALKDLYAEAAANPELLVAFDLETATSWEEDEDESIEFSRDTEDGGDGDGEVGEEIHSESGSDSPNALSRDALDIARAGIRTVQFSLRPGTGISCDWSDECRDWVQRIMSLPNPFAGHNCFHRNTSVWMSDGSWKSIWQIRVGELVKTLSTTGHLIERPVTDTVKVYDDRPWVEVVVDGAHNTGLGKHGCPGVVCTPDHEWKTTVGWMKAEELVPGLTVYLPRVGAEDVIVGTMLGDGHCTLDTNAIRIAQSNKEWAKAKATALDKVVVSKPNVGSFGKTGTLYQCGAIVPKGLRKRFYAEDGSRIWHEPSVRALAIWYCDDGHLVDREYPRISIDRYKHVAGEILEWATKTFGKSALYKDGTVLALGADAARKFFTAIAQYVHPSMYYKLPGRYCGKYDGWMEKLEPQLGKVLEVKKRDDLLQKKFGRTKYCLTVEETHSFFTRSGLVKNCWLFDEPILRNHGIEVPEGTHDTLWLSHHLQPDLPKHLQGVCSWVGFPFPWKHLSGADLDFYGAADVDGVQWIMRDLSPRLERLGLWDGYERYVRQFRPVLAAMERRGIPVSKTKLEELRTWLSQEIARMDSELQPMIPSEWKGRKYWKTWPADLKPWVKGYKKGLSDGIQAELEAAGKRVTKKALSLVVKPADMRPMERGLIQDHFGYGWEGDLLYKEVDFNPRSSQQILSYIKAKGYPVPLRFKDKEETTSDKELERLEAKTKDPVLTLVRGIRAYSKMGNAYAGKLLEDGSIEGGWQPGPDGRLRATVTFGPATGQLSARNPNIMTTPKRRAELANKFRQCIVAEPGHKLVECVTPDTPILTANLVWTNAGDLEVGDKLIGFDQEPILKQGSKRSGRYLRNTEVVTKNYLRKPCVRIKTDKHCSIKCSTDHLLLVRRAGKARWVEAGSIRPGESISFFTYPWEVARDYDSGWLAGFLDGEGFCSDKEKHGRGVGFGQNPGVAADKAIQVIEDLGFVCQKEKTTTRKCVQYQINGHQFAWVRLLGMVRPVRLLAKAISQIEGMAYWGKKSRAAIVTSVEDIGEQDVVAVETTTGTFIANGMLSHNCDYTAFHARTLGLAAQDAAYMKLAAMDIHSFVAGHMIRYPGIETALSLSDSDLKQFLEEIKSKHKNVRNFKAKPAILGIGFKMGKRRLFYENRDSYESEAEAGKLIDLLHRLFPNVFKWQDAICEKADREGRLINSWGACRWFWDVMKWTRRDGQWVKSTGRDAEKATAYLPSSNAHFMLRDKLLQANSQGWLERYGLINVIHDAVLFHCPTPLVDECVANIKALMEAPVPQMADPKVAPAGFTCGAEAMVGSDWSTMEEVH